MQKNNNNNTYPSAAAPRLFIPPELFSSLGQHLTPPDLVSCVSVCRLWNAALIPVLWRVIDDSLYSWPRILAARDSGGRQDERWLYMIFAKYGTHIRRMEFHWSAMFAFANWSGTCTNLRRIAVYDLSYGETLKDQAESDRLMVNGPRNRSRKADEKNSPGKVGPLLSPLLEKVFEPTEALWRTVKQQRRDWMSHQHLWLLIRQNPRLCSLRLDDSLYRLSSMSSGEFLYKSMALLPDLVEFECNGVTKELGTLLESLPRLERLASFSSFLDFAVPYKTFTQLREFDAWVAFSSFDFFLLLKRLPNLEYLHCVGFRAEYDDGFVNPKFVLGHTPSNLKRLHFEPGNSVTDEQTASYLIPWLPKLTEFVDTELMPLTIAALRVHCRDLERVGQLRDSYEFYSEQECRQVNELSLLLSACPRLKSLDRIRVQVEMDELLAYPWASTSLERISCQVSGVTRLNEPEKAILEQLKPVSGIDGLELSKEEERVLAKVSQSREQQREVYDRFGSMRNLKQLDFGYDYDQIAKMEAGQYHGHYYGGSTRKNFTRFTAPVRDTLELNLASGLDRLGGLQELEVFGFDGVDHRIGIAEVAWMVNHWPKLKIIRGLQVEEFDGDMRKLKKMQLRMYMLSLRPHIVFAERV